MKKLEELKKNAKVKPYHDPVTVHSFGEWLVSYCIENDLRVLAVSRVDGKSFKKPDIEGLEKVFNYESAKMVTSRKLTSRGFTKIYTLGWVERMAEWA